MVIPIIKDGWTHAAMALALPGLLGAFCAFAGLAGAAWFFYVLAVVGAAFMLFFFRDPERQVPGEARALVAGADGLVRAVENVREDRFLNADAVRISIFLSPLDVHVNRAPMGGKVVGLEYTPGRHLLTITNEASEFNEHSSILIEGERSRCLVRQIVGPIVRRVMYWLTPLQEVKKGDRIGLMKFGSRLDMYFPVSDIEVRVKKGDRVRAGESVVAVLTGNNP